MGARFAVDLALMPRIQPAAAPPIPHTPAAPATTGPSTPVQLDSAVELGPISAQAFRVATDGSLMTSTQKAPNLSDEIEAMRVAVAEAQDNQPLQSVSDVKVLRAVASRAATLHQVLRQAPRDDGHALELRTGRAAALGLIEAAARRAGALGEAETAQALTLGLTSLAKQEPFRPLRDFTLDRSLSLAEAHQLPEIEGVRSLLYPAAPPYAKWLRDGVVRATMYVDNDGARRGGVISFFEDSLGFKRIENTDGSTTMKRLAAAGKPPIEVTIPATPKGAPPPALFEKMGDPSTDIIIYSGHAGYGRNVEDSLSKAVSASGEGKLVVLLQCSGESSAEGVARVFPDAQMISTTHSTDVHYAEALLTGLVKGIDAQAGYDAIRSGANESFNRWLAADTVRNPGLNHADYVEAPIETHYFYPNQREAFIKYLDRDHDGVKDLSDSVFNVVAPRRTDASGGYDPLDPGMPLHRLDGSALSASIDQLNLVARYAKLPQGLLGNVPWNEALFAPAGYFEGAPTDLRAFRFELPPGASQIKVSVNAAFSHTPKEVLSQMAAVEAGQFLGLKAGLSPTLTSTLSLAMLERIRHQARPEAPPVMTRSSDAARERALEAGPPPVSPLASDIAKDRFFRTRYDLGLPLADLAKTTGNPDDFTPESFEAIRARVEATPGLNQLASVKPRRASVALDIPPKLTLPGYFEVGELQNIVTALGVKSQPALPSGERGLFIQAAKTTLIPVRSQTGALSYVSLGLDAEGRVRAASLIASNPEDEAPELNPERSRP